MTQTGWLPIFQQFRAEVQSCGDIDNYERICKDFIETMEEFILNG